MIHEFSFMADGIMISSAEGFELHRACTVRGIIRCLTWVCVANDLVHRHRRI